MTTTAVELSPWTCEVVVQRFAKVGVGAGTRDLHEASPVLRCVVALAKPGMRVAQRDVQERIRRICERCLGVVRSGFTIPVVILTQHSGVAGQPGDVAQLTGVARDHDAIAEQLKGGVQLVLLNKLDQLPERF